jgi:acetyltransferase-like isoleucine patch superfamily enzyme
LTPCPVCRTMTARRPVAAHGGSLASRPVPIANQDIAHLYDRFLDNLRSRLENPKIDRDVLCRDVLTEIHYGAGARYADLVEDGSRPVGERMLIAQFDPRNVTLEAEYYAECDPAQYNRVKPLLWLWIQFDHSPLGHNVHLGVRLRQLLAKHVFRRCGQNVRIFRDVEVSFGYNLAGGDNTTIHRKVLLDDRGEIVIGSNVSISDYANIYSHAHDIEDIERVVCGRTVIGDGARITYHAVVLSGMTVGKNAMVGTMGVVTRSVLDHHINVGIPAKSVRVKREGTRGHNAVHTGAVPHAVPE